MDNKNPTKRNIFVVAALAVLVLGGVLYFSASRKQGSGSDKNFFPVPKLTVEPGRTVLEGQRLYQNDVFGFSFIYPEVMTLREVEEGVGAWTYIFQNPDSGEGFQIFVVPYDEEAISDERFLRDVPSGVRENVEDVEVGGGAAFSFDSRDLVLGPTKEVWFIHNGFLYEATAPKEQELLLSDILLTLDFK